MTGVGKDEGGMERREKGEKAMEIENGRERKREERIKTNSEMTHFLYCEKPTQQTQIPHTHPTTHTHTHTLLHPHRNLQRMSSIRVHIYKKTHQHICAPATFIYLCCSALADITTTQPYTHTHTHLELKSANIM